MKKAVMNFSDGELIETLKKEHVSDTTIAFLYRNYFNVLSSYVKQNQGSQQDAEDIFQEVIISFMEIIRKGKFRGESSVKTFLFTLNKFTWLNELKKRGRALLREEKFGTGADAEDRDVSHFLIEREAKTLISAIMDKLGDACRKILMAYYYENLSMKEILPLVDYENEQVLRNKKYKCLKSLEQMLTANSDLAQRFKSALTYEN